MKSRNEITYDGAAEILGCSPRHVRRVIKRHNIQPIRRGHRTASFPSETIIRLKAQIVMDHGRKAMARKQKLLQQLKGLR